MNPYVSLSLVVITLLHGSVLAGDGPSIADGLPSDWVAPASRDAEASHAGASSRITLVAAPLTLLVDHVEQPADEVAAPATGDSGVAAPALEPTSFWDGWKRRIEVGLLGSDGNSETLNIRAFAGLERLTSAMETRADVGYNYATDGGRKSRSRFEANGRNDWRFTDSRWGFFSLARAEYDEFQVWDWRLSTFAGPSYTFMQGDKTLLRGRAGLGVSYELGGDTDQAYFEGLLGIDFKHDFTDRQHVFAQVDYFQRLSDWPEYRFEAKAGYEIVVDPEIGMSLRLGATDRYDSSPGEGFKRNDIEYYVVLAWAF